MPASIAWRAAERTMTSSMPTSPRGHGTHDATELFHRLQAEGVAAAPVQDQAAQLADPHLAARGFYRENSSIEVRPTLMPDHLWRWDGPPLRWGPFNRLGDANEEVFRGILGLDDAEYAGAGSRRAHLPRLPRPRRNATLNMGSRGR